MSNLKKNNLLNVLNKEVLESKKPIMGICLGMQIMGSSSTEKGLHKGLNWIKGKVLKLKLPPKFKAPHVGWNQVSFNIKSNFYSKNINHQIFILIITIILFVIIQMKQLVKHSMDRK